MPAIMLDRSGIVKNYFQTEVKAAFPRVYPPTPRPFPLKPRKTYTPPKLLRSKAVTVCLAAIVHDPSGPILLATADTKLSWDYDSIDDATLKIRRVNKNWIFSFASSNTSSAGLIVEDLRKSLSRNNSLSSVAKTAQAIHEKHTKDNWQFVLAGFDDKNIPHLFHIQEKGKIQHCDLEGFASIGAGQFLASTFMCFYPYQKTLPLAEAVYCVLAAKFTAERADGVGKNTTLAILRPGQTIIQRDAVPILESDLVEWVREKWESMPRIPDGVQGAIETYLAAKNQFIF